MIWYNIFRVWRVQITSTSHRLFYFQLAGVQPHPILPEGQFAPSFLLVASTADWVMVDIPKRMRHKQTQLGVTLVTLLHIWKTTGCFKLWHRPHIDGEIPTATNVNSDITPVVGILLEGELRCATELFGPVRSSFIIHYCHGPIISPHARHPTSESPALYNHTVSESKSNDLLSLAPIVSTLPDCDQP